MEINDIKILDDKIVVSDEKVLEVNEKAIKDTSQLLKETEDFGFERVRQACIDLGEDYTRTLPSTYMDKGRTIWLKLKVEDSFMSNLLINWIHTKSKFDGKNLYALGCSLLEIMFQKPSGFSAEDKNMIAQLYDNAIGKDNDVSMVDAATKFADWRRDNCVWHINDAYSFIKDKELDPKPMYNSKQLFELFRMEKGL